MEIVVVTLAFSLNSELRKTISSVVNLANLNPEFFFKLLIVSPKHIEYDLNEHTENLQLNLLKDNKEGIYQAFNLALMNVKYSNGFVIFLSQGDFFNIDIKLNLSDFENNDLISFPVKICSVKSSKSIIYEPRKKKCLATGIPHPSTFFKISKVIDSGLFPVDLGTAADLYLTNNLINLHNNKVKFKKGEPLSIFYLGGVSNKPSAIIDFYKVLIRSNLSMWCLIYSLSRKIFSFIKYKS